MEKTELYNQISHEIVKNYNTYLHPEDVKIPTSLEIPPHFTISHILKSELAKSFYEIALKLKDIDESLILNDYVNYHITFFWKGLDSKLDEKSEEITNIIGSYVFNFDVEELLFGPLGISVKFYPTTESLIEARTKIYELTQTPITIDERFVTTWTHLATYSQTPKPEVKKFIQENTNINFGQYQPDDFTLYISNNKGLVNPQKIKTFNCA